MAMMIAIMTVTDMTPKARIMFMKAMMIVSNTMMMTVVIKMMDTNDDDSNTDNEDNIGHHDQGKNYDDSVHHGAPGA